METSSLWYHRQNHVVLKQRSDKRTALYELKGHSAERTLVWTQFVPDFNIQGIQTVHISYHIVLNCLSDNHVVLHMYLHRYT